jgi:hypothetical protein
MIIFISFAYWMQDSPWRLATTNLGISDSRGEVQDSIAVAVVKAIQDQTLKHTRAKETP